MTLELKEEFLFNFSAAEKELLKQPPIVDAPLRVVDVKYALNRLAMDDPSLHSLSLAGFYLDENYALQLSYALQHNRNCESLDLSGCGLTPQTAQILLSKMHQSNVVELNLSNNPLGNDGVLLFLKSKGGFQSLDLRYTDSNREVFNQLIRPSQRCLFGENPPPTKVQTAKRSQGWIDKIVKVFYRS